MSHYWHTTVSYLCVFLCYGSITPPEEKHLLWQKPPGSWHWISQLQGVLRVNLFHRAFPHSPLLTLLWIDDAWPNSTEGQSSTQCGSNKQETNLKKKKKKQTLKLLAEHPVRKKIAFITGDKYSSLCTIWNSPHILKYFFKYLPLNLLQYFTYHVNLKLSHTTGGLVGSWYPDSK